MQLQYRAVGLAVLHTLVLGSLVSAQSFDVLFRVGGVKGACLVKRPDAAAFEPVLVGRAYPFGTVVRTGKDGEAYILLSSRDTVRLQPQTEVSVTEPPGTIAFSNRVIHLTEGKLDISVRDDLAEKALVVETAAASCDSFTGHSAIELSRTGKSKTHLDLNLSARTESGSLRLYGEQFSVPKIKPGSAIRIESSTDRSITRINNESNDYRVEIDRGIDTPIPLQTSTRSTIRICREHAPQGGRLVVNVLETSPDGKGKSNFAFVYGDATLHHIDLPTFTEATGTVSTASTPAPATNTVSKTEATLF